MRSPPRCRTSPRRSPRPRPRCPAWWYSTSGASWATSLSSEVSVRQSRMWVSPWPCSSLSTVPGSASPLRSDPPTYRKGVTRCAFAQTGWPRSSGVRRRRASGSVRHPCPQHSARGRHARAGAGRSGASQAATGPQSRGRIAPWRTAPDPGGGAGGRARTCPTPRDGRSWPPPRTSPGPARRPSPPSSSRSTWRSSWTATVAGPRSAACPERPVTRPARARCWTASTAPSSWASSTCRPTRSRRRTGSARPTRCAS